MFKYSILFFHFLFPFILFGQTTTLKGKVIDANSKAPLAFVNYIIVGEKNSGTTDIDGKFTLSNATIGSTIKFSYVGYETLLLKVNNELSSTDATIKLKQSHINLGEVIVKATENPALKIIRKVVANKEINDPEKMASFKYTSYNKMIFTGNVDSISTKDTTNKPFMTVGFETDSTKTDSVILKEDKFLAEQHLFMMESVTERKLIQPGRSNETILATRVSGFKNESFVLLATQLQAFSFYKSEMSISDKEYLNPIDKKYMNKYVFIINDTLYKNNDTVFVISFQPKKGTKIDGLKGILYINSNKYAIQNVIAEPSKDENIRIKIQQLYENVEGKQWFPKQLNTDITFLAAKINGRNIIGIGRSYIQDVMLNPELRKKDFSHLEVKMADNAADKTDEYWNKYRVDSLSQKEKKTYQTIDSIGEKLHFDRKLKVYEAIISGKIPYKFVDFDINRFLWYNLYEGFRVGAGVHTNDKIVNWASVGGYFAYGFKDTRVKYGIDLQLKPFRNKENRLRYGYTNDLIESGGSVFFENNRLFSSESYRGLLVSVFDKIEKHEIDFAFRAFKYARISLFGNTQTRTDTPENTYEFGRTKNEQISLMRDFKFTEVGINLKYAYREKFISTAHTQISRGTDYPIFWLNITKGIANQLDGDFNYLKIEAKTEKSFRIKRAGTSYIQMNVGYTPDDLPYTLLFNGKGSFIQWTTTTDNTFETMGMNEFLSSTYFSVFYSHDFGNRLISIGKFNPSIRFRTAAGWGRLQHQQSHFGIPFITMDKGFYESGIEMNKLFSILGVGIFYRYGPYANSNWENNIAVKFTFGLSL